jgi:DNA-binding response OmpR family regulator
MTLDSVELARSGGVAQPLLIVEHDPEIAVPLVEQLTADGYPTTLAHTAQHARALAAMSAPALVILGHLDSPHEALQLLCAIRTDDAPWRRSLPVIVLASPARPLDLLRAFAAGADDFLARPPGWDRGADRGWMELDYLELLARLRSLLRRASHSVAQPSSPLRVGPLLIDPSARSVLLHGHPLHLRPREYSLLLHLAREPTRVFSRHDLLRAVWDFQGPPATRTLDSHACRLRAKLVSRSPQPWVLSVRGVGYRLTG